MRRQGISGKPEFQAANIAMFTNAVYKSFPKCKEVTEDRADEAGNK